MPSFLMFVRSQPQAGQADAFNAFYEDRHIDDLMRVPGIVSARRYEVVSGGADWDGTYLGIYEIEADDVESVERELASRRGTDEMPASPPCVDTAKTFKLMARAVGTPRG